jgi:CubicO group peptidase (beta-lactamase class C family)
VRHLTSLISSTLALAAACVAQPPVSRNGTLVSTPLGVRVDSVLNAAAKEGFSGVALVEKNGQVILKKGYGMANRAESIWMTPATVVQIGSNTKDFTAVAILQLMERGQLRLQDSIGKYFDGVPEDKRTVTILQLLRHRAGFPQHLGGDFDSVSREQEVRNALAAPLLFPPGQGRSYSNSGYSLLGAIIEQVSGKTYDVYVRDEILEPIGLKQTGFLLPDFDPKVMAHGYSDGEDRGTMLSKPHASDGPWWNLRANGGMLSTVSDMYNFYRALAGGTLLKPATRDLMYPPNQPVVLAGSDLVNFFLYNREPQAKVTIILASNAAALNAERVRDRIAGVLGLETNEGPRGGGIKVEGGPPAAPALAPLPDTPAGHTVTAYLKVYNSVDLAAMREFIRGSTIQASGDTRSLDQRVAGYKRIHDDLGALRLIGIVSSTPDQIVARMAAGNGDQVTMTFDIEAQSPYRLRGLRVEAQ